MKTNEIMKSVSLTFNKVGFQLQKKSPEILVAAGVVGVVVSAVMACQATPKALKVAEKTQDDVERIQSAEDSGVTQAGETYTKEDARGDRMQVYAHTGFQYIRLYAPRRSAGRGVHHLHPHQPQAHEKAQHGAGGGLCHPGQTL